MVELIRMHRICIVADHAMFRQGLAALLAEVPGFDVVGQVTSGPDLIQRIQASQPDVVLLDSDITVRDAIELTEAIVQAEPAAKVVVLAGRSDDAHLIKKAILAGATGIIPKFHGVDDLVEVIETVARSQVALPAASLASLVQSISDDLPRRRDRATDSLLTPREEQILELLAEGSSNQAIAAALRLSESTVRSHVHSILGKLEVSNRVQAAAYAIARRNS